MKKIYTVKKHLLFFFLLSPLVMMAQSPTTTVASANCNFTYNFNSSDEGFSSPSIYSDANDLGIYWDGSKLAETSGLPVSRTASVISGIFLNPESSKTTVGFDYTAPAGTQFRIRIISGQNSPPLEILATTATGPIWTSLPSTSGSLCLELQDADLPIAAQIRYEITFRMAVPGDVTIDNFRRISFNAPLPVTFLGFIARDNTDGTVKLLWNVGEESNVRGYEVQSSTDGINFVAEGFVNSASKDNYSFSYNQSFKGNRYFRIRNVDNDNNYKYTGIIKVRRDDQVAGIKVYPVPAHDQIYIEHPKTNDKAMITMVSADGRIMLQTQTVPGSYQTSINIRTLNSGFYFLRYDDGIGQVKSVKFVKN